MFCRVSIPVIVFFAVSVLMITMCFTGCISSHCVLQVSIPLIMVFFCTVSISVITMCFSSCISDHCVLQGVYISYHLVFLQGVYISDHFVFCRVSVCVTTVFCRVSVSVITLCFCRVSV